MTPAPAARLRLLVPLAVLLVLVLGALRMPAAQAAPAAPTGLTPDSVGMSGIPTLTWNRSAGATVYTVQVSTSASFANPFWSLDTVNRSAVPQWHLPKTDDGKIYWRVRAVDANGPSAWANASFDRSALAAPTPLSPADGATLVQPSDPALLSWAPVDGAVSYRVEIDTGGDFIGPQVYDTQVTSLLAPDPNVATKYYWRVTATLSNGATTQPSAPRTYTLGGLAKPVLVGPEDNPDAAVPDGDVVLEWKPVAGAARYNVQVSTDISFPATYETRTIYGVTGTRYSPPATFGNDQYYWRVQPVDAGNHQVDWGQVDVWHFQRTWPDQPVLEYPANGSSVGAPLFYQWSGVHQAARYRLELSLSSNFNQIYMYCETKQTTYVPTLNDCLPQAEETVYWRVIAYDDNCSLSCAEPVPHTDAVVAAKGRFTYDPSMVTTTSPASGTTLGPGEVPVLRWNRVVNAARYRVTVTNAANGAAVLTQDTAALALVPRLVLAPGTYRWDVQTVSQSGRLGPYLLAGGQPTFTIASAFSPTTGATPTPGPIPPADSRLPLLTWTAVEGATSYRLYVRLHGTTLWSALDGTFGYPAAAYETVRAGALDLLSPDTYNWMVEAYASNGALISDSGNVLGTYQIVSLADVSGQRVALTGTALSTPSTSCGASLVTTPAAKCQDLRQSPVLRWDPVPGAGSYTVYISRDREMTNILTQYTTRTQQNMWTYPELLADSQAGTAYYWVVVPCVVDSSCNAMKHADNGFNKLSNGVELSSPVGGKRADIVTFTWRDFLMTNGDGVAAHLDQTGVSARQEAARYQLQVSTVPNFESLIDDQLVDQTTYTAYDRTYPEGLLYWRVRAWDGTSNPLSWSLTGSFLKESDHPRLVSPTDGAGAGVMQPFRWEPMSYAGSYDVEVYSGTDTIGQLANRVLAGNSKQVAFTTTVALAPGAYSWRVRRVDSGGRVGPWSPLDPVDLSAGEKRGLLYVTTSAPVPTSPAAGSVLAGNEAAFSWLPVTGASSYLWQRREPVSGNVASSIVTRALAWAANDTIPAGSWQWSVIALDVNARVLGQSPWQSFSVSGPVGPGGTGSGTGGGTGTGGTGTGGTGTGTGGTGATDLVKPQVTSIKPAIGSKIKRTSSFTILFSEPVVSVTTKTIVLTLKRTKVKATVTLGRNGRTAVLKPTRKLKAKKKYVLKVTAGIRDAAGNPLVAKSAAFRTKS